MPRFQTQYIEKDTSPEEVVEAFGALLTKLNALMNNFDSQNVRRLSTNSTQIKSDDGTTKIDGSQLVMLDGRGTERIRLGLNQNNGTFEFKIMDGNGRDALTLSSTGNAVFKGDISGSNITGSKIDIEEDISVGNNIYLGAASKDNTKSIVYFDGDGDAKKGQIIAVKQADGSVNLTIKANKLIFSTASGVFGNGEQQFITTSFSPFVEIDGVKHYVTWK